jgi:MFS family permease
MDCRVFRRPPAAAIIGTPPPPTNGVNRNLLLLAFCQALFLTNNVTFIAINGLVGLQLAPWGWMATLPVTGYVVGAALSAMPVARLQARLGRQRSFQIGLVVAAASAASCALAVGIGSFWLLVASTVVAGFYSANGQLYRFAGIELAAPAFRERALSWVLAGGVLGAFLGPNLASATRGWFATPFVGAYVALVGVALVGLVVMGFIRFPALPAPVAGAPAGRPNAERARPPIRRRQMHAQSGGCIDFNDGAPLFFKRTRDGLAYDVHPAHIQADHLRGFYRARGDVRVHIVGHVGGGAARAQVGVVAQDHFAAPFGDRVGVQAL